MRMKLVWTTLTPGLIPVVRGVRDQMGYSLEIREGGIEGYGGVMLRARLDCA